MKFVINLIFKILVWIPPVVIAMSIFGFSSQNAEESSGLSTKAAIAIIRFADDSHIVDVNDKNETEFIENLQYPIRKCAHMTEYMIFTLSVLFALFVWGVRNKLLYIEAFAVSVIFASTDEFHQLFVPGRSGMVSDVLIDSTGAAIGLFIVWGVGNIIRKRKVKGKKKTKA